MCENTYEKYMMEYQKALDETYEYTKDKEKKMKIKKGTEQGYKDWYNKNLDPYGHACFTYAERWAEMMEAKINELGSAEEAIINYAERFSHEADKEGITGFMYGVAVRILSIYWEYGEILRK